MVKRGLFHGFISIRQISVSSQIGNEISTLLDENSTP
jgi:hypothetical protein